MSGLAVHWHDMYPIGLLPIGLLPIGLILIERRTSSAVENAIPWFRDLVDRGVSRVRAKLSRLLAWAVLFGGLLALEIAQTGQPQAGDALAFKVAAVFSFSMFSLLPGWMLASHLAFMACFMGWHAVTGNTVTGGSAIVSMGISPVVACVLAFLANTPPGWVRRTDWFAEDSSFGYVWSRLPVAEGASSIND